ncbi:MFS transporter [Budvicia diplopodorum]|uniref:MFS transporter n=1 Tax=Budvicia diplopodorum TaxID=1119056 RepID=UPI00135CA7E7|nr:MFS transporter [Budvicia diplopodorum]
MSISLPSIVNKTKWRLIPFMLMLYILAFLDRSNIGFAKQTYQLDIGLSNEAYALGAGLFFVVYAFLGAPANLCLRKFGAKRWIGVTTLAWGALSMAMGYADSEAKFLTVRVLLGIAEAGFFPGMIYLTSQWFPQSNRASVMGLFYMGAPLAMAFGSPLSGALLELHGLLGHPGWFWMFIIEGGLAFAAGLWTFYYLDDAPTSARFLSAEEKTVLINQLRTEESKKEASSIIEALKNPRIWHLALIYGTIQCGVYGLIFFLPTQVASIMGSSVNFMTSVVTAIPWICALFGTFFIPRYSDRTQERRKIAAATLFVGGIAIMSSSVAGPYGAIIALCLSATAFFACQPIFWAIPTSILSGSALAVSIGFINMFGAFFSFAAPIIRVHAETVFNSPAAGLVAIGSVACIGSIAIMALRKQK